MSEQVVNHDAVREALKSHITIVKNLDIVKGTNEVMEKNIILLGMFMDTLTGHIEQKGMPEFDIETSYDIMEDSLTSFRPKESSSTNDEHLFNLVAQCFSHWVHQLEMDKAYDDILLSFETTEQEEEDDE